MSVKSSPIQSLPITPVYEWILDEASLAILLKRNIWRFRLSGYSTKIVKETGGWTDDFFKKVSGHYGWLVARTASYLKWRYLDHPDYDYTLILVCKWGQPVGWWLGRVEGNTLLIGDALFDPEATYAPQIGLISWLRLLQRSEAGFPGIRSGGQSSCTDWASRIKGSIRIWISALLPFLRCLLENFLK